MGGTNAVLDTKSDGGKMDEKYKDIMMVLLWVFSVTIVVMGMNYLYIEFGTNTPIP